jgi:hypothetical protein
VATESDLRDLLRGPEPEGRAAIDLDTVLTRARRRRRPRVVAAQALGSVAVVGALATGVVLGLPATQPGVLTLAEDAAGGAADEAASGPAVEDGQLIRTPSAATLNACAAPVNDVVGSPGLVLELVPLVVSAGEENIPVAVTLRNTGADRVVGSSELEPTLTLSREGIVVWHSNGPRDLAATMIDLDPGEAMTYTATLEPIVCGPEDTVVGFRDDLPAAEPGSYELRAALDVAPASGATAPLLVTGPPVAVDVR